MQLYRKREQMIGALIGAGIMGAVLLGVIVYYQGFKLEHVKNITTKQVTQQLTLQKDKKEGYVWLASEPIEQGNKIDKNKLQRLPVSVTLIPEDACKTAEALEHKVSRFKIAKGTILTESMFVEEDKVVTFDLRKQDYFNIKKFYALKKGDYVDVRLKRKDGSDDVVLAKKEVLDIVDSMLCFNINESERQRFNAAGVEALVNHCEIYTTLYVDPQNQPTPEATYQIDKKVLEMIKENPSIVDGANRTMSEVNRPDKRSTSPVGNNTGSGSTNQNLMNPSTQNHIPTNHSTNSSGTAISGSNPAANTPSIQNSGLQENAPVLPPSSGTSSQGNSGNTADNNEGWVNVNE